MNLVEIQKEELFFPPSDVLQLKSYYLSSSVQVGAKHILIGYNHKEHAWIVSISGEKNHSNSVTNKWS